MFGIFVHETASEPFAKWIVTGAKTIETRTRDTLKSLVGERVAIVSTRSGKPPMVVGFADVTDKWWCPAEQFGSYANHHLVCRYSKFYPTNCSGKWMYELRDVEAFDRPEPLPKDVIYHGRAYCEFYV